jgi:Pyruvate/2-oxoacid:ferredoxin oxidoreductase delta subunit
MPSRMGQRYPRDYTEERLREIADDLEKAVTVPVNVMVEAEHRVYDLSEMKEILGGAEKIVLQDCGCKTEYDNCDSPQRTCLNLDRSADQALEFEEYNPQEVSLGEAVEALEMSHKAGLVHMAYTMKGDDRPTVICSCCPCCCHTLGGLLRFGISTHVLTSSYVAEDDVENCINCGACVDRCVFMARNMTDGEMLYDVSNCFGCGLCVSTCPTDAIGLIPREDSIGPSPVHEAA